jgi:hypothetical protein
MSVLRPMHVAAEINPVIFAEVVKDLELQDPPTFTTNGSSSLNHHITSKGVILRGTYDAVRNHVILYTQSENEERTPSTLLRMQLQFTMLHELRHAWQRENWDAAMKRKMSWGKYEERGEERDANEYAENHRALYPGLIKVKVTPLGKTKSRLPG